MRILMPRVVQGTARCLRMLTFVLVPVVLLAASVSAQQPPAPKKKVPTLNTDDVVRPRVDRVTVEPTAEAATAKSGEAARAAGAQTSETKVSPEESAWRERVKAAREKAKTTERAAEEGELRTTQLRNELGVSGRSAKERNETAAALDEAGKRLVELRAQARQAATELNTVLDEGRQKGFAEPAEAGPAPAEGKADEQYYRDRYAKLLEVLQTAERRMQLYEDRIRAFNERLNNPNVDRFATAQLRQDRDDAQQKLDEARAVHGKAQSDIQALMDEARRAGVPPSAFR